MYNSRHTSNIANLFKVVMFIGGVVLLTRMLDLQVVKGAYYRSLSEGNRLRSVVIQAPRGKIYARGGELLADNLNIKKTLVFDPKNGYIKEKAISTTKPDDIIDEWNRSYPLGAVVAHAVGYLGKVDEQEVGKPDPHCINKGIRISESVVGRSGLEEQYDCELRGIDGKELVEVDIQGKKVRTLGLQKPIPGTDINTTIDYGLQKKLSQSFKDLPGAAIATDMHGQILALYSNPSFDPSIFLNSNPTNDALVTNLFSDSTLPLFDRAISGAYHPGSVFKIVVATGALEDRIITPDFVYQDTGSISINGFNYSTWYFSQYGKTEGNINLEKAIARSTDTFFYKVGEMTGIDQLVHWADQFGVGKKTGIDLPGEVSGLLPSPQWKERVLNERWFLGNTYHFSIGQGDTLMTPLQTNLLTATMANGGFLCSPSVTFLNKPKCAKLTMSQATVDTIYKGMQDACASGGTGYPFFDFEPTVACKTGTAETGTKETHAWFTVIAPAQNPEIILTVLVEKGGEGSKVAAPIAKEALDYWFHVRSQK